MLVVLFSMRQKDCRGSCQHIQPIRLELCKSCLKEGDFFKTSRPRLRCYSIVLVLPITLTCCISSTASIGSMRLKDCRGSCQDMQPIRLELGESCPKERIFFKTPRPRLRCYSIVLVILPITLTVLVVLQVLVACVKRIAVFLAKIYLVGSP